MAWSAEIDALAAHLKQKYFLVNSDHDKTVEAKTCLAGENKPWVCGQGNEPSKNVIDEAKKKTAQPGITAIPFEELDFCYEGPK